MSEQKPLPVTAIILAGGKSTRMDAPKAFAMVGGRRIIEREIDALSGVFTELLIVTGEPGPYEGLGVRLVPDTQSFGTASGPMLGAYSGLAAAINEYGFIVGCDMPFIVPGLAAWLAGERAGRDIVVPVTNGFPEPLFAVYKKGCLPAMEKALRAGNRRLQGIFGGQDVRYIEEDELRTRDPGLVSLTNVNTPAELAGAELLARGEKRGAI